MYLSEALQICDAISSCFLSLLLSLQASDEKNPVCYSDIIIIIIMTSYLLLNHWYDHHCYYYKNKLVYFSIWWTFFVSILSK